MYTRTSSHINASASQDICIHGAQAHCVYAMPHHRMIVIKLWRHGNRGIVHLLSASISFTLTLLAFLLSYPPPSSPLSLSLSLFSLSPHSCRLSNMEQLFPPVSLVYFYVWTYIFIFLNLFIVFSLSCTGCLEMYRQLSGNVAGMVIGRDGEEGKNVGPAMAGPDTSGVDG